LKNYDPDERGYYAENKEKQSSGQEGAEKEKVSNDDDNEKDDKNWK